jgi:protocatechuate 3,4-dioxygenase, alpha subunit
VTLPRTPSQTVGPYYTIGLCRQTDNVLDPDGVELTGRLVDGQGEPIGDGMIEVLDPAARAWGRSGTDDQGRFSFLVRPDADVLEALVFARGILRHERTRIALAELRERDDGPLVFDIHMQGENATVFYEV